MRKIDLSIIPKDWFLQRLCDVRSPIHTTKDRHEHLAWGCELQHVNGGRLQRATGETPQQALDSCVERVRVIWEE